MNLTSERLLIQLAREEDIPFIHTMNSCEEVARFNTIGVPASLDVTAAMLKPLVEMNMAVDPRSFYWVLKSKTNQEFIGGIGMNIKPKRYRGGEIHYSLHPDFWGKGYATEGVNAVIAFGFEKLMFHRITAGVSTGNSASIKLLEKVGMIREGMGRKILPIRGQWEDNYEYSILETDPRDY